MMKKNIRFLHVVVLTLVAMIAPFPYFYRINFQYQTLSTTQTCSDCLSDNFLKTMEKCLSNPIFEYELSESKDWLTPLVSESPHSPEDTFIRTVYVIIGDSLDRILVDKVCKLLGGKIKKVNNTNPASRPMVCRTPQEEVQIAYLNIFGMAYPCKERAKWDREDDREFETTAERISVVLPELLGRLKKPQTNHSSPPPPVVVSLGSNLWDLSVGCNDEVEIVPDYAREYQLGMKETYFATKAVLESYFPNRDSMFFWKLAPPVSQKRSDKSIRTFRGRNRFSQMELNRLIVDTLKEQPELGTGFLDLWNLVLLAIPSEDWLTNVELKEDGRHYSTCPSLAFFNFLLEATQQAHLMRQSGDVSR